ncbi:zinc finger E-box-binding homeobox 1-like [Brachionichthys hirsutus]|uniref:zinc finger E-box-binding homeobox 1-like n=1 Tax=Brachionichthys hirsutus TaxID=412623 RepID=UPI003604C5E4
MEMSSVQRLRTLVSERLNAAADDIVDLFCIKIREYEEEVRQQRQQINNFEPRVPQSREGGVSEEREAPAPSLQPKHEPKQELKEEPVGEPVGEPVEEPVEEPVGEPVEEPVQGPEAADAINVTVGDAPVGDDRAKPRTPPPPPRPAEGNGAAERLSPKDDAGDRAEEKDAPPGGLDEETENSSDYGDDVVPAAKSSERKRKACSDCSVCGKRYRHKGHLKRHMATHAGGKPFSCSICGRTFSKENYLASHMVSHSRENKTHRRGLAGRPVGRPRSSRQPSPCRRSKTAEAKEAGPSEPGGEEEGSGAEQETDDSDDWEETQKQTGLKEAPPTGVKRAGEAPSARPPPKARRVRSGPESGT